MAKIKLYAIENDQTFVVTNFYHYYTYDTFKFFLWLIENDHLEEGVTVDPSGFVVFLQPESGVIVGGETIKSKLLVKVYTFRAMWDFLTGEVASLFIDEPIEDLVLQYIESLDYVDMELPDREEDIVDNQINDLIEGKHE